MKKLLTTEPTPGGGCALVVLAGIGLVVILL